jgi:hypothetical protein
MNSQPISSAPRCLLELADFFTGPTSDVNILPLKRVSQQRNFYSCDNLTKQSLRKVPKKQKKIEKCCMKKKDIHRDFKVIGDLIISQEEIRRKFPDTDFAGKHNCALKKLLKEFYLKYKVGEQISIKLFITHCSLLNDLLI